MSLGGKQGARTKKPVSYDFNGESFFKQAFARAAIGLALVDLHGRFAYTNTAYSRITGYSAAELKKLSIGTLMFPEDAEVNARFREQMLAGEIQGYVLEKRYIRKDGSLIWVKSSVSLTTDSEGRPVHIIGLTEDIDERHKAEEALRESEARFRFMAEYMPPKVFTANARGDLTYLSPQWTAYTGLDFADMSFDDWTQTIHPDDREDNMRAWRQVMKTGEPFYFEHRLRRADGTYRWHVSRAHALRDKHGAIVEWIGSATDIEELRESRDLQDRLRIVAEQREQLLATNRLKDEFIMLASHQLRTPATGVKQYVGMLLEGYSDALTDDQRQLLQRAFESNERQIKIVDDLLKVARVDAGQISLAKESCDLVGFIRDIVAGQRNLFYRRKQRLEFRTGKKVSTASFDKQLLRVVLDNLLDNASKYSPVGKMTTIGLTRDHEFFVIEVQDNGIGIRKQDQLRLFQKFSRIASPLSEAVTGTGLGLYWSQKIVELHGGSLEVESKIRHGSTFRVLLPVN